MLTQSEIDAITNEADKWFLFSNGMNTVELITDILLSERQRAKVLLDEKDKEINDLKDFISQMQHL